MTGGTNHSDLNLSAEQRDTGLSGGESASKLREQALEEHPSSRLKQAKELIKTGGAVDSILGQFQITDSQHQSEKSNRRLDQVTQQSRDELTSTLRDRFKDSPVMLQMIEEKLNQFEQRIFDATVEGRDRKKIDRQNEIRQTYRALSSLTDGQAEKLEFGDEKGTEQKVFNRQDVDQIIVDAISRLSNPDGAWNQGHHGTCALESIGRQEAALSPSTWMQRLADVARTGYFKTIDLEGGSFDCKVDRQSLRLDPEARISVGDAGIGIRGAAGQLSDLALGQLKWDLQSKQPGRFIYSQDRDPLHNSSGEAVWDTAGTSNRGEWKFVQRAPFTSDRVDSDALGRLKQSAFGYRFGDDFGRATTLVNGTLFPSTNSTNLRTTEQLQEQLEMLEKKGWSYSTLCIHLGNWQEFYGSGGWHAVSVNLDPSLRVNLVNNWGGYGNVYGARVEDVIGWTGMPDENLLPGGDS